MKFEHNYDLSIAQRKEMIEGLTKIAELYFNGQYDMYGQIGKVTIGCGICKALSDLGYKRSYEDMAKLMLETNEYSYGCYVSTPEE
jgi:hypothetical protein